MAKELVSVTCTNCGTTVEVELHSNKLGFAVTCPKCTGNLTGTYSFRDGHLQMWSVDTIMDQVNMKCYRSTMDIVKAGKYETADGKTVELEDGDYMQKHTKFYSEPFDVNDQPHWVEPPVIRVLNMDSLDAAKMLLDKGYDPIVLNMANRKQPGGGGMYGTNAQEESIFRRTNLFQSLYLYCDFGQQYGIERKSESYPLDRNWGGIYSPCVSVFRMSSKDAYALLDKPYQVNVVTVAAINYPELDDDGHLMPVQAEGTKNKIRTIYRIALSNSHTAIVLGAWGCGAFGNPPADIARLFHEVLEEPEFRDKFKAIAFAILDNPKNRKPHNPEGNLKPFEQEFKRPYYKEQDVTEALTSIAIFDWKRNDKDTDSVEIPQYGNIAVGKENVMKHFKRILQKGYYMHFPMGEGQDHERMVIYNVGMFELKHYAKKDAITDVTCVTIDRSRQVITCTKWHKAEDGKRLVRTSCDQAVIPDTIWETCKTIEDKFNINVPVYYHTKKMEEVIRQRSTYVFNCDYRELILESMDDSQPLNYRWFVRGKLYGKMYAPTNVEVVGFPISFHSSRHNVDIEGVVTGFSDRHLSVRITKPFDGPGLATTPTEPIEDLPVRAAEMLEEIYTNREDSKRFTKADWDEYQENIAMLYQHKGEIYADQEMFFAATPLRVYGFRNHISIGKLLLALDKEDGGMWKENISLGHRCMSIVVSFAGSPMSGSSVGHAVCIKCGKVKKFKDGGFGKRVATLSEAGKKAREMFPTAYEYSVKGQCYKQVYRSPMALHDVIVRLSSDGEKENL